MIDSIGGHSPLNNINPLNPGEPITPQTLTASCLNNIPDKFTPSNVETPSIPTTNPNIPPEALGEALAALGNVFKNLS